MITVAYDPGADGGCAWEENGIIDVISITTNCLIVADQLCCVVGVDRKVKMLIYVEDQHPMPGNGSPSVFTAGRNFQTLLDGIMIANYRCPLVTMKVVLVPPTRWKSRFGVMAMTKMTRPQKKILTFKKLLKIFGKKWCDAHLRGPRNGYKDGRGDAVGILLAMKKEIVK